MYEDEDQEIERVQAVAETLRKLQRQLGAVQGPELDPISASRLYDEIGELLDRVDASARDTPDGERLFDAISRDEGSPSYERGSDLVRAAFRVGVVFMAATGVSAPIIALVMKQELGRTALQAGISGAVSAVASEVATAITSREPEKEARLSAIERKLEDIEQESSRTAESEGPARNEPEINLDSVLERINDGLRASRERSREWTIDQGRTTDINYEVSREPERGIEPEL